MSKIMTGTYLLAPDRMVANERDRLTSRMLGEFLRKASINFEVLPWIIPPVSGMQDEQHYSIDSRDEDMERRLSSGKFIVVNTSGYAHSRTYFFEKVLKIPRIHFSLDSHADLWNWKPGIISSEGFNAEILDLQGVEYCDIRGVSPNQNLLPKFQRNGQIEKVLNRLDIYLTDKIDSLKTYPAPWADGLYEKIMKVFPAMNGFKFKGIPDNVAWIGRPVYVSVDLDILQDFPSDWRGHGRLNAKHISRFITRLGRRYRVIAGDICGVDSKYKSGAASAFNDFYAVYNSLRCAMQQGNKGTIVLDDLDKDVGN